MKLVLVGALVALTAAPVVFAPIEAEAQVRVGSGAHRDPPRRRASAPRLSEAERDRINAAQDEIADIDAQRAAIIAAGEAADGLTDNQRLTIKEMDVRRAAAQ